MTEKSSTDKPQASNRVASGDWLGGDERFDELMNRLRASGISKSVSASEWEEVVEFIEGNIRTEESANQKGYDEGYKAGQKIARADVRTWILGIAADAFKAGKDEDAKHLRNLANMVAA